MHGKLFDVLKNLLFVGLGGNECIDDDFEDKDSLSMLSQVVTENCGSKVISLDFEPSTTEKAATDEGVKIHEPSTEKVPVESINDDDKISEPLPIESSDIVKIDEPSREKAAIESSNDGVEIDEPSSTEKVPIESIDDEVRIYGLLPVESSDSVKIDESLIERAAIESSSEAVKIDEPSSTEKAPIESVHKEINKLSTEKPKIESDTTNETILQYLITIATLETKLAAVENQNIFVRDVCDKLDTQHSLTCAAKTEELRNTVEMNSREISELVKQRRKNVAEINEMKQKIFEQQKKIEFLSKSQTEQTKDAPVKMIEQMPEEMIEEATEPQTREATDPQIEETTEEILSIGDELSQSLLPPLEVNVENSQEQLET